MVVAAGAVFPKRWAPWIGDFYSPAATGADCITDKPRRFGEVVAVECGDDLLFVGDDVLTTLSRALRVLEERS